MEDKLTVGDKILWSGGHGTQPFKTARVEKISFKGKKHNILAWKFIWSSEDVLLSLDNGHWCYGKQIKKIQNNS